MNKRNTYFVELLLFTLIFAQAVSHAQSNFHSNERIKKLDAYLAEYQKNKAVASISAGAIQKGKIIWQNAFGYADISHKVPATPNTVYRIASISKLVTAVAVMQLVEKGKIKLDEDARKYIPYFPKKKWKFTVRQILQHTAGLRTYRKGEFNSTNFYSSTREAVGVIQNDSLVYKPGTKYVYTTLGYNLLAAIIEDASGLSFTDYLRKYIFEPAEMNSTYPEFHQKIIMNKAVGYVKNKYRNFENAPLADLSIKFAGGGLISTSGDLLKFANAILLNKFIKHSTLDSMLVPVKLLNGRAIDCGLGFEIKHDKNNKFFYGHFGYGTGFISLLAIFPEDSLAVVDLINTDDRNLGGPALDLASIILNKPFNYPLKPLQDKMMEFTLSKGIDSAISFYKMIKTDSANYYDLSAEAFNEVGYDLLKIKDRKSAIRWFSFYADEFPQNISPYLGLGDTYYNDNNKGLARKYYRKALKIDFNNSYAKQMISKLESD